MWWRTAVLAWTFLEKQDGDFPKIHNSSLSLWLCGCFVWFLEGVAPLTGWMWPQKWGQSVAAPALPPHTNWVLPRWWKLGLVLIIISIPFQSPRSFGMGETPRNSQTWEAMAPIHQNPLPKSAPGVVKQQKIQEKNRGELPVPRPSLRVWGSHLAEALCVSSSLK